MDDKLKSKLELFDVEQNNWIIKSWHKDTEHAIINADVISKSRKCRARVIYKGNIIFEVHNDSTSD